MNEQGARLRFSYRELKLLENALSVYIDGLAGAINHDERDLQLLRLRIQEAQWRHAQQSRARMKR